MPFPPHLVNLRNRRYKLTKQLLFPYSNYSVEAKVEYIKKEQHIRFMLLENGCKTLKGIKKMIACSVEIDPRLYDMKSNRGFLNCFSCTKLDPKMKTKFIRLIPNYYRIITERFDRDARI